MAVLQRDAEHALDPFMHQNWVSILKPAGISARYRREALEIVEALVRSEIDVVVDSVLLVPKAEIEGEMGDSRWTASQLCPRLCNFPA